MYLLDTNILIWVLRENKIYVDVYRELKRASTLYISTITIAEIYKNVYPAELIGTEEVLSEFEVWDVTVSIAKQGGLYWQQYSKNISKLNILDCLIAATAKEHDLTLLTLNTRHFPMKDIRVMSPLDEKKY